MKAFAITPALVLLLVIVQPAPANAADRDPAVWEKAIAAFEKQDEKTTPPQNAILFVGSSSIRFWPEAKAFPDVQTINRGFGGAYTSDVLHYFDRIVTPYRPRQIVLYAGDNDIAAGKSPEEVLADTQRFFERVQEELPNTRIVYVAIKPSLARWELVDTMREVNRRVRNYAEQHSQVQFLDVDTPMLGDDGKPRHDLFIRDGLHLSPEGYALWNELLRPLLQPEETE